ncbi:MAG TPA: ABC transporter substrate-binding protein [Streptosporangiaceae bacterium]|jgi:peptide/nickel transport system substrate-binding protein|nr:ABC transporter substrate-binding protein [Streptosporangiaceae bacterium]
MRTQGKGRLLAVVIAASAMLLGACSSSGQSPASARRVPGGTATIALNQTDSVFNYIFPLLNFDNDTFANVTYSQYLMWRPLYWFGSPGHVGVDENESLANAPSVTTSGGKTTATIQLKPYRWSDGTPVTSRDVEFWINLLKADKAQFWGYEPGEFPDNLTSLKILSPSRFTLTFDHAYSAEWLYNQLGLIIPLPQHAWDKESASGPVGNYDLTTAGALAVDNFLLAQNKALSTYATNPLWQVVDGPWKLTSYAAATGDATYVRNSRYSGPATGSLHAIKIDSYTSDGAEFNQLLSSTGVDFGYVPFNDAAQVSRVKADGYTTASWPAWGINYVFMNYAAPQAGALFQQLYLRQAMQHLINQTGYIKAFLDGYGYPTYGPVPQQPASDFVSPQETTNPYSYSPSTAVSMLRAHGWKVVPSGTDTCLRPGSGPNECGAGIASGAKLTFSFQYATGSASENEEVAALQSSFAQAGIKVAPAGAPFPTVTGGMTPGCTKPSCWQMAYVGEAWLFDPGYNEPDGAILFGSNGPSNLGGYSSPEADTLIGRLGSGGVQALYAYQNYLAKQLPGLWMPQTDTQISAVNSKLRGVFPLDPLQNVYPEDWYFVK